MHAVNFSTQLQISHALNGLYLIEASAGTGKTYTISNLYLRHVIEGREVSEILVATFSKQATQELKGRIRLRLYQAQQQLKQATIDDDFLSALMQSLSEDNKNKAKRRVDLALRSMDESAIYSIHGFCQKVLSDFAFLSGQPYQLEMNNDKDEWLHPFILDWWRNNVATQKDTVQFANYQTLGWTDYQKFQTFYQRIAEKKVDILPNKNWQEQLEKLQNCYQRLQKAWQKTTIVDALIDVSCYKKTKTLLKDKSLLNANKTLTAFFEPEQYRYFPKEITSFSYELLCSQFKKGFDDSHLPDTHFFKIVDEFITLNEQQLGIFLANKLNQAKQIINQQVKDYKKKKQQISFDDLLNYLQQALTNNDVSSALINAIQNQYPVAFIDEFQDTDNTQYAIFKSLYFHNKNTALYMIGDPKQAIYSFRGGDIITYIQAKQDLIKNAGQMYTLNTNWRSTPQMIETVNSVFAKRGNDAFLYGDMIPFEAVEAPTKKQKETHRYLTINGKVNPPMHFWVTKNIADKKGKVKPLSKQNAYNLIDQQLSNSIVNLLNLAKQNKAMLGDKPLKASDIAILVPKHDDAQRLQTVLQKQGVQSVVASNISVYQSAQAGQLLQLLKAVLEYKNHQLQRNALANELVNLTYEAIHALINDEKKWSDWCYQLKTLNERWQKHGFMAMFMHMIYALNIVDGIKKTTALDRNITNLLHLAELIQQASKKHSTHSDLLSWFAKQVNSKATDETQIRLESDASLVKISTLHVSKGLEYGVVFLPYLWGLNSKKYDYPIYHKDDKNLVLECATNKQERAKIHADYERMAEQVRLVYVALTRSVACCYIGWGNISSANEQALAYLLNTDQQTQDLKTGYANCKALQNDEMIKQQCLALSDKGLVNYELLNKQQTQGYFKNKTEQQQRQAKTFNGEIDRSWQITSYSRLTKNLEAPSVTVIEEKGNDEIFDFPAGKKTGSYLHELLEKIDFQQDLSQQLDKLNPKLLAKYALHEETRPVVENWLTQILTTPFASKQLSLQALPSNKILKEMVFNFSTKTVKVNELNRLLKKHQPNIKQNINAEQFKGIVNGIIDCVFEWQGQFYLADYKSNLLGRKLDAYSAKQLEADVIKHRYDFQYLLYSVAVHKYLQSRLPNYSYKKDFGGVYYFYLRAMRIEHGKQYGVYFIKPDEMLINELAEMFE